MNIWCFDLYKWQNFPFTWEIANKYKMKLNEPAGDDWVDNQACALTTTSIADSWFIVYGYFLNGKEYVFAWKTPHDEIHRGYGNGPSEFYDLLNQNFLFKIRVNRKSPREHYICEPDLKPMNDQVFYCNPSELK